MVLQVKYRGPELDLVRPDDDFLDDVVNSGVLDLLECYEPQCLPSRDAHSAITQKGRSGELYTGQRSPVRNAPAVRYHNKSA